MAQGGHLAPRSETTFVVLFMIALMLFPSILVLADDVGPMGPVKNSDSEPNNTLVEATVIDQYLSDIPGDLDQDDDVDFYKVYLGLNMTALEVDRLRVEVDFQSITAEPKASILDPWGFVLEHQPGTNVVMEVSASPDNTGYFYIQLRAQRGTTSYNLRVNVAMEPITSQDDNNEPNSAFLINGDDPDIFTGSLVGEPLNTDLQDFYKVHIDAKGPTEPGLLSLYLNVYSPGQFRLEVYDSFLTPLAEINDLSDPTPGHDTVLSYITEGTGDFYIRVWAANGTAGYELIAHVMTIPNLQDWTFSKATNVQFTDPNPHVAFISDGLGHNSYPGPNDDADFWKLPVLKGQFIRGTVTSLNYDPSTTLPHMRLTVYDDGGNEYMFNISSGETFDSFVDPKGGFDLFSTTDGFLYIEVGLEGEGSGGGSYALDIYTDRPPQVIGHHDTDVFITDEGPVELLRFEDLFEDPEGDRLEYSSTLDSQDPDFHQGLQVDITDNGTVILDPRSRYQGEGVLKLIAEDMDWGLRTELAFNITIDSCGCHKVLVKEPYNLTGEYEDPIELIYNDVEELSIDLSDIFYDPLGAVLEYGIDGEDLVRSYSSATIDPPGEYLDRVVVKGSIMMTLQEPTRSGLRSELTFTVLDAAVDSGTVFETSVQVRAWPMDDRKIEMSRAVTLRIVLTHGPGHAPEWLLPNMFEMDEDEDLVLSLDEYIDDVDELDQGNMEYSVKGMGMNLTVTQQGRDEFLFEPREDWCGVEALMLVAKDTFGWETVGLIDLEVGCVSDGPSLIVAVPPIGQLIEIFEGEDMAFTVVMADMDTSIRDLVYDWYINGYPDKADAGPTYLFDTGPGYTGTHKLSVEVKNSVTGEWVEFGWTVRVKHINLAPSGWIEVKNHANRTHIVVDVGNELSFLAHGVDPERNELNYTWYFGDGSSAKGRSVDHSFLGPGKYVVTLIINDGEFDTYAHFNITARANSNVVPVSGGMIDVQVGLWFALIVLIITMVGAGSTEPGRFRIFLMLTVLYSKIRKTKVLDHYLRGRIQGYITANPGAHYNMIKVDLQINNGNLAYHLSVLERQGFVKSVRDGIYKRFYPDTMRIVRPPSLQERILVLLRTHPGMTQKEIAIKLDEKPSTVNDYIRRMAAASLLRVERAGVKNHCYIMDS